MRDCKECNQNIEKIMEEVLAKFQEDLIEFAKNNWASSFTSMLEGAIECVCKGENTYPGLEEGEERE